MVKKILKFGGTSVVTIERIQHVANIIKKEQSKGNKVIAVVSAMAGKTNELMSLSKSISDNLFKTSRVLLLSDLNSSVPISIIPGNIQAIVIGDGRNSGEIKYIKDNLIEDIQEKIRLDKIKLKIKLKIQKRF